MSTPHPANNRLSDVLRSALDVDADGFVTVGEIMERVAERSFGLLLFVVALPTLVPILPPGASSVVGVLYISLSLQMLMGLKQPWMPARIRRYRLSPKVVASLQKRGVALMEKLERVSRPRWSFASHPLALRALALPVLAMGLILLLPVPFMNTAPAFSILIIGLGLLNRDGLMIIIGAAVSASLGLVFVFGAHLLKDVWAWLLSLV